MVNNYNVKNIYFEGAIGNLDFGWLNSIKDENIKKNIANKLLIDGKITGAEYFGFFNKKKNIFFKGLEDEQIYKEIEEKRNIIISDSNSSLNLMKLNIEERVLNSPFSSPTISSITIIIPAIESKVACSSRPLFEST